MTRGVPLGLTLC